MPTNQKRQRGQPIRYTISRVYASQLAKATIKQTQIEISVEEALRINQSHVTRTDLAWHDFDEPDYF
jgi:hypothetical protein